MKKPAFFPIFLLLLAACAPAPTPIVEASATPQAPTFSTATLAPTATLPPSLTPAPPTLTPTLEAISGTLSDQVNVRIAPDPKAQAVGLLNFGTTVEVVGKNAAENWYLVVYMENGPKTGWVAAQYVQLTAALEKVRVVDEAALVAQASATATETPKNGKTTRQINVRSGPAGSFDSLGLLEADSPLVLTGRDANNTWLQIEYPDGPNGRAWVAAAYVEAGFRLEELPIFDLQGNILQPGQLAQPGGQAASTPTTLTPALDDVDDADSPAARINFSASGPRLVTYTSDLSSPTGDRSDWIELTLLTPGSGQAAYLYFELDCTGTGGITVEVRQNGLLLTDFPGLVCGQYDVAFKLVGGQPYLFKLTADGSAGDLRYVRYDFIISTQP